MGAWELILSDLRFEALALGTDSPVNGIQVTGSIVSLGFPFLSCEGRRS